MKCFYWNEPGYVCDKLRTVRECITCNCRIPAPIPKPPLGLKLKKLHRQERMHDILRACMRYTEANKEIPEEWIEELNTINRRIY